MVIGTFFFNDDNGKVVTVNGERSQKLKIRLHQENYLNTGFTWCKELHCSTSKCVVFGELVVKEIKPHTIGETLVLSDCSAIIRVMFSPDVEAEMIL